MKMTTILFRLFCILLVGLQFACKEPIEPTTPPTPAVVNDLYISPKSMEFRRNGGSDSLLLSTTALEWEIKKEADWVQLSSCMGLTQEVKIAVTVDPLEVIEPRETRLSVIVSGADTAYVVIAQNTLYSDGSKDYPDYSDPVAPDENGVGRTATAIAAEMAIGWNLGNTLEVPGNETGWGNPKASQRLIDSVYAAGFTTIRIPCAWDTHVENSTTAKIYDSWLDRVQEVVDYCFQNGMYVILNAHWDGGWLEEHPTYEYQEKVNRKQKAYWEQIAVKFRDYDDHLLFAGTNEVHYGYGNPSKQNIEVHQSYLQTFVDAVRSTGGKNAYRPLVVQAYNTNIDHAVQYLQIPEDTAEDRLFVEIHYYDPWDFCGEASSDTFLWGAPYTQYGHVSSWGQEDHARSQFTKMKTNFVQRGYPVILGEYAPTRRSSISDPEMQALHYESRAYYLDYLTRMSVSMGCIPCYWDNGHTGDNGSGIFDRNTGAVVDRTALDGLTALLYEPWITNN